MDQSSKLAADKLEDVRLNLLRLHKVLLDFERLEYEKINGQVSDPSRLLSLVMSDPFFDWLHRISQTIVRIDEMQDSDEEIPGQPDGIFADVKKLILPGDADTDFANHYRASLQRNPAAVLAHAAVLKALHGPDARVAGRDERDND